MTHELSLIGAAFPRTGTMSVKRALEYLGLGQCYHMHEVFLNPEHIPVWRAGCNDKIPDWQNLFAGYAATLDAPACLYWKELALAFPDAKVLLLRRDPDTWYESMYSTVFQTIMNSNEATEPALEMIRRLFLEKYMKGRFEDKDFAISTYRRYCNQVIEEVPRDRLLVYEVSQGWAPLCAFLGYDIPQDSFPKKNKRDEFGARSQLI